MSRISYGLIIRADADRVFDLISKVEDFPKYSTLIEEVRPAAPGRHLWRVRLLKMPIEWESEIVESERPVRFAWKSVKGVYTAGSYTLSPFDGGTRVEFEMEYRLTGTVLDTVASPLISRLVTDVYTELLRNVRKVLEGRTD